MSSWQFTFYIVPVFGAFGVSLGVAIYALKQRPAVGAVTLSLLMFLVACWCLFYGLQLMGADLKSQLFWAKMSAIAIFVPHLWFVFSLQYTKRTRWFNPRNLILLAIIPLLTLGIVWTNESHYLYYNELQFHTTESFGILVTSFGGWFWISLVYSYLLLFGGTFFLVQSLLRSSTLYRGQTVVLLIGVFIPWLGHIFSVFDLVPDWGVLRHIELTPSAFAISGIALSWGLFRYRLLDIIPVARDIVVENMAEGVIVLDANDRVVDVNPIAEKILVSSASYLIGQPIARVFPPSLISRLPNRKDMILKEEIFMDGGEYQRFFEFRVSPISNSSGRFVGRLILLHDVTERKRAENLMRKLNEELEDKVFNRTEELELAKEKAEESDRLKTIFLNTISHEVRTPLNVILGYIDLCSMELEGKMSDEMRDFFQAIHENGERLKRLIDDILDVATIEAGIGVEELQIFGADDLVRQTVAEIIPLAKRVQLEVIENYGTASDQIKVDKRRFQHALGNILHNAIKFTHQGSITVATAIDPVNDFFRVKVTDTGIGIKEEYKKNLFSPFSQQDQGFSRGYEGAGLGLAVTKRFVSSMGGHIEVETEVDKGSAFTICLPLLEKMKPVSGRVQPAPTKLVGGAVKKVRKEKPLARQKILLVEDDPDNRKYIETIVTQEGFDMVSVPSAEDGLRFLGVGLVDCMIIDISLPGMSGVEFMRQVRQQKIFDHASLIAVTAHAQKGDKERFLREGFDDYLAKPFNVKEFRDILQKNLKNSTRKKESPSWVQSA